MYQLRSPKTCDDSVPYFVVRSMRVYSFSGLLISQCIVSGSHPPSSIIIIRRSDPVLMVIMLFYDDFKKSCCDIQKGTHSFSRPVNYSFLFHRPHFVQVRADHSRRGSPAC